MDSTRCTSSTGGYIYICMYTYLSTTEGCPSGGVYVPCMPGESYCRWLGSLLCLCDVFLINSLGCGFCRSALGLVLVPIVMMTILLNGWHGWRERHHSVQCQPDVVAAWPDPNIFKCFVQNKKGFFSHLWNLESSRKLLHTSPET